MTAQIKPDISTWVDKAEQDLRVLRVLLRHAHDCWDAIGFHSQQAAEKYIKAVLAAEDCDVPKIHSLVRLIELTKGIVPELTDIETDAAWLTGFAVDARYPTGPGPATTREHAERAINVAEQIKDICLFHLKSQ